MRAWAICAVVLTFANPVAAALTMPLVPVGNPGNTADTRYVAGGRGAVPYGYMIGKHEVTAGQYATFLNAVAKQDTYSVYHTAMAGQAGIQRSGPVSNYSYSVTAGWENRPIVNLSYSTACRFANWMANGQPTGPQDLTTENGSYFLDGNNGGNARFTRRPGATWVIPTVDEWYKAAYYDSLGSNYWTWPTHPAVAPTPSGPATGNAANMAGARDGTTAVASYPDAISPFGAFDMAGNVSELVTTGTASTPGAYGGLYTSDVTSARASTNPSTVFDTTTYHVVGMRLVFIPEPSAIATLALVMPAMLRRPRRVKRGRRP